MGWSSSITCSRLGVASALCLRFGPMAESVCVNFSEPIALFPLPGVLLLPHAALPLHIFEPRYRQMVERVLKDEGGTRQFAMATLAASPQDTGRPPRVRDVVCVGHIAEHQRYPDGRFDLVLRGLCRARILDLQEPEGDRLYRQAMLGPLELPDQAVSGLTGARRELRSLLAGPRLQRLQSARVVLPWIERDDLPCRVAIELVAYAMVKDDETRYAILSEGDANRRAGLVWRELKRMDRLLALADRQGSRDWPKGLSWN